MASDASPEPAQRPEITRAPATGFVLGLLAGLLSGLLGIGGGLLVIPGLVLLLRVRQHRATGTSLLVTLLTAVLLASLYQQGFAARGRTGLDLAATAWLAVGSVAGALPGAVLARAMRARGLHRLFGGLVLVVGLYLAAGAFQPLPAGAAAPEGGLRTMQMLGTGVLVGVLGGLVGGGGVLMVPALVLALGMPQHLAQAFSLAILVPVSVTGVLLHLARGNVIWTLAPWLAAGSIFGGLIAVPRVFAMSDEALRVLFGVFLVLVGGGIAAGGLTRRRGGRGADPDASGRQ